MICYAIKNDKGKYLAISEDYNRYWIGLGSAFYFTSRKLAERYGDTYCPDCKVVKVEIKEIEDGKID